MVELLGALVIIGVLLSVAAPGAQSALSRDEVRNEAIRLAADIQFARGEAAKHHAPIKLCPSKTAGEGCIGSDCGCINGLAQRQWDDGWLAYTAAGGDASFDPDTDTLLRVAAASPELITIRANEAFNRWISIDGGSGALDEAADGKLAVCMNGESTEDVPGMLISLDLSGRPLISAMAPGDACDYPSTE